MQRIHRAALLAAACLGLQGCGGLSRFLVYQRSFSHFSPCPEASLSGARFVQDQGLRYIHATVTHPKALVLFYHGVGNGSCERAEIIKPLLADGCDVALAEYPGYAEDGETNEALILANSLALRDKLAREHPGLPLILYGESLGTGVATYVAQQRGADGLILQSPYTSVEDVGASTYWYRPVRTILTEKYMAKDWAKGVASPVLAFYALDDWVIPNRFSIAQAANFSGPVQLEALPDAGHNSMRRRQKERYYGAVARFIDKVALCQ